LRKVINYPNAEHPLCEGACYVDEDSDPDVAYYHYKDFRRPGWPKARTFILEVDKATGKAREVRPLGQHFPVNN
jgi:hypothetical protein